MTLPEDLHAWRIYSLSFFNQIFMKLSKYVLYCITNYFEFNKFSFLLKKNAYLNFCIFYFSLICSKGPSLLILFHALKEILWLYSIVFPWCLLLRHVLCKNNWDGYLWEFIKQQPQTAAFLPALVNCSR